MKFQALFAREGLSLGRLRTLVLIDEAGGIAAAAPADHSRQSLFSRQHSLALPNLVHLTV